MSILNTVPRGSILGKEEAGATDLRVKRRM